MEHMAGIFFQIDPEMTQLILFEIGNFEGWQAQGTVALIMLSTWVWRSPS